MSDRLLKQMLPDEKMHKVDLHEELDGDQAVVFYYVDPGHALERHAGKSKFRNEFYYQYEREKSWTHPGVRVFGRVNGGLAFQGFQCLAGNVVPLCHVFYTRQEAGPPPGGGE
eukprot:CAMPEP_0172155152 /NCGR_PEP_ID=MMETSP1050-20130122/2459_1 /TAXON_ID=233186 /ORGANISM="Cryptomonas curvata, Strain CCAP979/52" /LENGTH=112 /DNA_ID=CAMNT_0012824003 /DNA_START=662 /DNA_END=997 /DNA_ORIENTATION=+